MGIFKKKDQRAIEIDKLVEDFEQCKTKKTFYLQGIKVLLFLLKEFSLDIIEIGSDKFKEATSGLSEQFIEALSIGV